MEEFKLIVQYAPYLVPFLGAIILIIFTKKYLFAGMVSTEMHAEQITREREIITVQETVANRLEEIVKQLESLTKKVSSEISQNTERLHTLEIVISDNLDAFRELNANFEKHRKMIPDTGKFNVG